MTGPTLGGLLPSLVGRLAVRGDRLRILPDPDAPAPRGYRRLTTKQEYAAWRWQQSRRYQERIRGIAERMAAEERAYAARRRADGLPPTEPVHPELVPELHDEWQAWCERGTA